MEPITIAQVIAHIESSGNPWAMRFEPGVYAKLQDLSTMPSAVTSVLEIIQNVHHCNVSTSKIIYSTSWGLYQIMGFNLYDQPYFRKQIGEFMADVKEQYNQFMQYLILHNCNYTAQQLASDKNLRDTFAKKYNGSIVYSDAIVSSCKYFGMVTE